MLLSVGSVTVLLVGSTLTSAACWPCAWATGIPMPLPALSLSLSPSPVVTSCSPISTDSSGECPPSPKAHAAVDWREGSDSEVGRTHPYLCYLQQSPEAPGISRSNRPAEEAKPPGEAGRCPSGPHPAPLFLQGFGIWPLPPG